MAQIATNVNKPLRIHFMQTDTAQLTRKQKPSVTAIVSITFYMISYLIKHNNARGVVQLINTKELPMLDSLLAL